MLCICAKFLAICSVALWDDELSVKEPREEVINSHHFAFNYNGPALFGFAVGALIALAKEHAPSTRDISP